MGLACPIVLACTHDGMAPTHAYPDTLTHTYGPRQSTNAQRHGKGSRTPAHALSCALHALMRALAHL